MQGLAVLSGRADSRDVDRWATAFRLTSRVDAQSVTVAPFVVHGSFDVDPRGEETGRLRQ